MALFFYKEKNKDIRAAAYLRLSIEDGDKAESNSIGNQRELIRDFAAERPGLHLVEEYADDGYTGTNFERPGFKRMMEDADAPWQIDSDEVIVLHVLAVHPNHRGKGLARKLVENVIEQERKAGKKALRLDVIENNTTAEKLYQKLGFRYIQTKTLYYDVVGEMTFKLYELVL